MTTLWLIQDLKADEGCELAAYPDPDHGWTIPTIGFGHTGRDVHQGLTWSQAQADFALSLDVQHAAAGVRAAVPFFAQLTDPRQDVLVNMGFNMGLQRLLGFEQALAAMRAGDWPTAKAQMLDSDWATAEGAGLVKRANRLALQMEGGQRIEAASFVWPPPNTPPA